MLLLRLIKKVIINKVEKIFFMIAKEKALKKIKLYLK